MTAAPRRRRAGDQPGPRRRPAGGRRACAGSPTSSRRCRSPTRAGRAGPGTPSARLLGRQQAGGPQEARPRHAEGTEMFERFTDAAPARSSSAPRPRPARWATAGSAPSTCCSPSLARPDDAVTRRSARSGSTPDAVRDAGRCRSSAPAATTTPPCATSASTSTPSAGGSRSGSAPDALDRRARQRPTAGSRWRRAAAGLACAGEHIPFTRAAKKALELSLREALAHEHEGDPGRAPGARDDARRRARRAGASPGSASAPDDVRRAVLDRSAGRPDRWPSAHGLHDLVADVEVGVDVLHVVAVLERVDQPEDLLARRPRPAAR